MEAAFVSCTGLGNAGEADKGRKDFGASAVTCLSRAASGASREE